jgi:nucleolar GTP-binding protein
MLLPPIPHGLLRPAIVRIQKSARQLPRSAKAREIYKVEALGQAMRDTCDGLVRSAVNFRDLPPFQRDLARLLVDVDSVRKSLATVQWAGNKIGDLSQQYRRKMKNIRDVGELTQTRKQFEARAESIMAQAEKALDLLDDASKKLEKMPSIKPMPTVVIAGYPNVGKSSILKALSGAKVDIQPYPFTTQSLLVGIAKERYKALQLVDTPGILDRERANHMERQAVAALRHLAKKIVFVVDPSESCGYPLAKQLELLAKVRKDFSADVLVVLNKKDLLRAPAVEGLAVSSKDAGDMDSLRKRLFDWAWKAEA